MAKQNGLSWLQPFFWVPKCKTPAYPVFPCYNSRSWGSISHFFRDSYFFLLFLVRFFPHLSQIRFGTKKFQKKLEKLEQKLGNIGKAKNRRKQIDQEMKKQKRHKHYEGQETVHPGEISSGRQSLAETC